MSSPPRPHGGATVAVITIGEAECGILFCTIFATSVSERISVCSVSSTGTAQAYCARRVGSREIKVPSASIFSNRVYRHVVLFLQLLQRLFLTFSLTTAEYVNSHL